MAGIRQFPSPAGYLPARCNAVSAPRFVAAADAELQIGISHHMLTTAQARPASPVTCKQAESLNIREGAGDGSCCWACCWAPALLTILWECGNVMWERQFVEAVAGVRAHGTSHGTSAIGATKSVVLTHNHRIANGGSGKAAYGNYMHAYTQPIYWWNLPKRTRELECATERVDSEMHIPATSPDRLSVDVRVGEETGVWELAPSAVHACVHFRMARPPSRGSCRNGVRPIASGGSAPPCPPEGIRHVPCQEAR